MLTLVNRLKKNGVTDTGGIVLNTACISKLQVYNTTQARFKFLARPEDRQGGYDTYIVSESAATIQTDMNKAFNARSISLNVYPDNDSTQDVVATIFNTEDIIKCYPHTSGNRTKAWIEINERGFKPRRYLIAHYYVNVLSVCETGTSTSTTTTTTTS